jgi:hypothetical protein
MRRRDGSFNSGSTESDIYEEYSSESIADSSEERLAETAAQPAPSAPTLEEIRGNVAASPEDIILSPTAPKREDVIEGCIEDINNLLIKFDEKELESLRELVIENTRSVLYKASELPPEFLTELCKKNESDYKRIFSSKSVPELINRGVNIEQIIHFYNILASKSIENMDEIFSDNAFKLIDSNKKFTPQSMVDFYLSNPKMKDYNFIISDNAVTLVEKYDFTKDDFQRIYNNSSRIFKIMSSNEMLSLLNREEIDSEFLKTKSVLDTLTIESIYVEETLKRQNVEEHDSMEYEIDFATSDKLFSQDLPMSKSVNAPRISSLLERQNKAKGRE